MLQLHTPSDAGHWLRTRVTGTLRTDSRVVGPGDAFLAWPGAAVDARAHVAKALAAGAVACLVERAGVEAFNLNDPRIACYDGLKAASGPIASDYFDDPSCRLRVLAVTGTNGKTSTAWWIAQALSNLKQTAPIGCGVVGTLGIGVPPTVVSTGLTTPDPVALQAAFAQFVATGMQAGAIEASSIGIEEHRLDGTHIHTAMLTNLTQDHLDYHGSMQAYWQAKQRLFDWAGLKAVVINVDDPYGVELASELALRPGAAALDFWTVSMADDASTGRPLKTSARLRAANIDHNNGGMSFDVVEGAERLRLSTRLIGAYNIANVLGVIAAMRSVDVPLAAAVAACASLDPVPGRLECVNIPGKPSVAIDYAHTPDALAKALDALRPSATQRGGHLWCVFGCGGDRDNTKRPVMGAIAARHADRVVVTSDNPRSESPDVIISQILLGMVGVAGVVVEPERALAIARTLAQAAPADVVLVAGKGHEDYQEIKGMRLPFSDLAQVQLALGQTVPAQAGTVRSQPARMSLQQVAAWLDQLQSAPEDGAWNQVAIARVHTDTRSLEPSDMFVALRGENFDANEFLQQARDKGAVAAICQGDNAAAILARVGLPGLVVPDAKLALAQLASFYRAQFGLPVIAVTGSNGKTTVTQMIGSILRAWKGNAALVTQGNLNNEIGVPLTVLHLNTEHEVAVVELGMNHPGEIAALAFIAQPTVALVNNAQREHLEFMHTVAAVAEENGRVLEALPLEGVAVYPVDDDYSALWASKAQARRTLGFAANGAEGASVYPVQVQWSGAAWQVSAATPAGELHYALHIAGAHNVKNSLAAIACALAVRVPGEVIVKGLEEFEPVKGRSRALLVSFRGRTLTLIDDSYNANPDSVRAAIDVLADLPAPRLLVLGDMGEVGDQGPAFHAEAGMYAHQKNIEKMLCIGNQSAQAVISFGAGSHLDHIDALNAAVLAELPRVASVLVKGSRFMKMERVVQAIEAAANADLARSVAC